MKLVTLKVKRAYNAKKGYCQDRICTWAQGLVFRNKEQWWADKQKRKSAR